jgi:beta-lactamase class D
MSLLLVLILQVVALEKFDTCRTTECFIARSKESFGEYKGCLYYKNLKTRELNTYGDCKKQFKPCSTFKIANALIGLETGVLKDASTTMPWDGSKQIMPEWEKEHNLKSAIEVSAVPYFQELARRVGKRRMEHFVKLANYGNKDIGTVVDRFWLDGPLAISGVEQVLFYEKLLKNQLPFKKKHQELVKDLLVLERNNDYVLSGKTGTDMVDGKVVLGWFVGHIRKNNEDIIFAINIQGKEEAWGKTAKEIAKKILL